MTIEELRGNVGNVRGVEVISQSLFHGCIYKAYITKQNKIIQHWVRGR